MQNRNSALEYQNYPPLFLVRNLFTQRDNGGMWIRRRSRGRRRHCRCRLLLFPKKVTKHGGSNVANLRPTRAASFQWVGPPLVLCFCALSFLSKFLRPARPNPFRTHVENVPADTGKSLIAKTLLSVVESCVGVLYAYHTVHRTCRLYYIRNGII